MRKKTRGKTQQDSDSTFELVEEGFTLSKGEFAQLRVNLVSINGVEMFDFRQYYCTKSDRTWKPTGKGFTLPLELGRKFGIRFKKFERLINDEQPES